MNDPLYTLKFVVKAGALPPIGLLLVALAALFAFRQRRQLGRWIAILCIGCVVMLATPLASSWLVRLLDLSPAHDPRMHASAGAIVILGGGTRKGAVEYGGDTLGRLTLERVRYGARVAKELRLPVLVSGGGLGSAAEAHLMRSALEQEFGVPVRWVEDQSRNTHENAVNSARILLAEGIPRAVLVAHSFDIRRAMIEFRRAGIAVVPARTGIPARLVSLPGDFIPSVANLQVSYYACYELLALLALHIRDWPLPAGRS